MFYFYQSIQVQHPLQVHTCTRNGIAAKTFLPRPHRSYMYIHVLKCISGGRTVLNDLVGALNLQIRQKRPTNTEKETYKYGKRDLQIRQKRPANMAKGTYEYGKRDLRKRQKRPANTAKETCENGKRDLRKRQKRPANTWGGRNGAPRSRALGLKAIASCRAL